ncbi:Sec-independent protein translocase protein TatB [Pigmentiphaga humi]|uniref:Sec-independent protein translocase protein TatB n=1 Tax=Pigmentiphaga humi TaxID=2478468 RepID=A0A3P4BA70_9BURK|nr:Sec-independent protein translocase protein TatB [Pigmentiphaga humi]VCU72628.1 Sec-independent protein translocase protein TatB [Pigmentiphaga humi]
MFDVSFTELMTIGVVALIVIGPERLPKVARTVGHLLGRAQRYVSDVKSDIRREMELDELRNLRKEMEDAAHAIETTVKTNVSDLQKGFEEARQSVEGAAREIQASASFDSIEPAPAQGEAIGHAEEAATSLPAEPAPASQQGGEALQPASAHAAADAAGQPASDGQPGLFDPDPSQASLFPPDLLPPAAAQPAAGQPAEATTVREQRD